MPVACWSVVHSAVAPVAQATMRAVRHVAGPIGRHQFHHVARAVRAVTAHPRVWIETVCRVMPSVVAAAILAVPPNYTPPAIAADPVQPGVQSGGMVSPAMIPAAPFLRALTPPAAPPATVGVVPGSTLLFFPPPAVTPPFELPPPYLVVGAPASIGTAPAVPPQSVPEPGSMSVLMMAIGCLILISRKRTRETALLSVS
jgi:hypothetical protein